MKNESFAVGVAKRFFFFREQLEQELAFMSTNADGLIVDEMRNTGGSLCFGQEVARRLIPYKFQATGFALRPYWTRILGFYNSMILAKARSQYCSAALFSVFGVRIKIDLHPFNGFDA
jgi:hypothetical protein